jgi:hypothetical protein
VYRLRIEAPADAVRGEPFTVNAVITGRTGQLIDPATVSGFTGLRLNVSDGPEDIEYDLQEVTSLGSFTTDVVLSESNDALTAGMFVIGGLTTADGTDAVIHSPRHVVEAISPGFINVQSGLDLGVIEASRRPDSSEDHSQIPLPIEQRAGELSFIAPRDVAGTACLGDAQWAIERVGLQLQPERNCVDLSPGESTKIPLFLRYDDPQAGPLAGRLPVTVSSALDGSERTVEVSIDGQVRIPPPEPWTNPGVRLLFLILGILRPAVLYLIGAIVVSRFNEPSLVQMVTHTVSLHPRGAEVGPALAASGEGSGFAFLAGDNRSVAAGSLTFEAPRRVVGEPMAAVSSVAGKTLVTSLKPHPEEGHSAVGHELNDQWIFVPTHVEGQSVVGEISALTRDQSNARGHADQVIADACQVLAGQREELFGLLSGSADGISGEETEIGGVGPNDYKW